MDVAVMVRSWTSVGFSATQCKFGLELAVYDRLRAIGDTWCAELEMLDAGLTSNIASCSYRVSWLLFPYQQRGKHALAHLGNPVLRV
jgi:hypothetical protein